MILVTGASGFLGKRVCRVLEGRGITFTPTSLSDGVDLRERRETFDLFERVRPAAVLNCAAFVGGIQFGYKHSAELFHHNLAMTLNLFEAVHRFGVGRIVNPISNCAYPAQATFFREDEFWDGPLHESVMVYGFVRKAAWVGSWAYRRQYGVDAVSLILSNMYGPEDHFEAERSHALGALIMKFVEAVEADKDHVDVWGSGAPVREWLHVDDGAEAMVRALDIAPFVDPINVGVGRGISVIDLARVIAEAAGFKGEIRLDPSKPDGAAYKTVDGSRGDALLGWTPQVDFRQGIVDTINWYRQNRETIRAAAGAE
jgi:GDP-L-fucose synthase